MTIAPGRKWRVLAVFAVLAAGIAVSAYFFWWKPLALTGLRFALDRGLVGARLRGGFENAELSGLNTLVIHNLSFTSLDESTSLLIRRLRLTFSLKDLILGRFKAPAALRYAVLDQPQLTLMLRAKGSPSDDAVAKSGGFPSPLIPDVPLRIRDGRLLVRNGGPATKMLVVSKIDSYILTGNNQISFQGSFHIPDSAEKSTSIRGTYRPGLLKMSASLRELELAPLTPWIEMLKLPWRPKRGRIGGKIAVAFSGPPETARMELKSIVGTVDWNEGVLLIDGLPFELEEISGRIRCSGTDFDISRASLAARDTQWHVEGKVHGLRKSRYSISARAPSLELSHWLSRSHGIAACMLTLQSGAKEPTLSILADARDASIFGFPCDSASAEFSFFDSFRKVTIHKSKALRGGNNLEVTGRLGLRGGDSVFAWTLSAAGFPVTISGEIESVGEKIDLKASSSDDLWRFEGALVNLDGLLDATIAGKVRGAGTADLKATIKAAPPYQMEGDFVIKDVPYAAIYCPPLPGHLKDYAVHFSALGRIFGEAAHPSIDADLGIDLLKPGYSAEFRGKAAASRDSAGIKCAITEATLRAPGLIVDGECSAARGLEESSGEGSFVISLLKAGDTDLEGRADISFSADERERVLEIMLGALRLNDQPYPDFTASAERPIGGPLAMKLLWEDLFSAVINMQDGRDSSIGLTAAFANLPIGPIAGFFKAAAPAQKASGSITLKGPLRRANVRSSLNWAHGDLSAKGWLSLDQSGDFSLTLNALEQNASSWIPLLRSFKGLSEFPDIESAIETHGFDIERHGIKMDARGWLSVRNLRIGGMLLGSGNLRLDKNPLRAQIEGSLKGDNGAYTLYPSEFTVDGPRKALHTEFSWKDTPVGHGFLSCDQGGLRIEWDSESGEGVFFLSGLALDESRAGDISLKLERSGASWRITPADDAAVKTTGTISFEESRFSIEPDERTEGSWLKFQGPAETEVKLSGTWKFPASPESVVISARSLPAPVILLILGVPTMDGRADTDLEWLADRDIPLSGRIRLAHGRWGNFPFDVFEITGSGAPGRSFSFSSISLDYGQELKAGGGGILRIHPDRSLELALTVDRLVLGYLKPFGFVEESSVIARGQIRIAGDPKDPSVKGTLRCDVGSFSPPLGFARLYLKEGQIIFQGHRAIIDAGLTDLAGAAVVVSGGSEFKGLVPTDFSLAMTAPSPVRIDGLPELFDGSAHGKLKFAGTIRQPTLSGKVTLEDGRLKSPPRRKRTDPDSLVERLLWDLKIRFGRNVRYTLDPLGGTTVNLATLSPSPLSLIEIVGQGEDVQVFGEVHADSGPLTLFLGKRIWKKRPSD